MSIVNNTTKTKHNPNYITIGQIFGKLTIIERAPNIQGKSRSWPAWKCRCVCNNEVVKTRSAILQCKNQSCGCDKTGALYKPGDKVNMLTLLSYNGGHWICKCDCNTITNPIPTFHISDGHTKSCGCYGRPTLRKYKEGDVINRLTLISFYNNKWICQCECGIITNPIETYAISSGGTKSCGCYRSDMLQKPERLIKLVPTQFKPKYEPKIATARRVWRSYRDDDKKNNKEFGLSFEQFYELSQQNCEYCGITPSVTYNVFASAPDNYSDQAIKNGDFTYNGLDRKDNNLGHIYANCSTCCITCNQAKFDRSIEHFLAYIPTLHIQERPKIYPMLDLPNNKSILSSIYRVFRFYEKDSDMTMQEFYSLSQLPCHYCGVEKIMLCNSTVKSDGDFYCNGLDRISSYDGHELSNVVPCCKYCNFAKNNMMLKEFHQWILRITNFQSKKNKQKEP